MTGCDETLSTSLGLMISGADTNDDCCAQSNVISVEGTSCELCEILCLIFSGYYVCFM